MNTATLKNGKDIADNKAVKSLENRPSEEKVLFVRNRNDVDLISRKESSRCNVRYSLLSDIQNIDKDFLSKGRAET
jgi:hypothetical protein